MKVIILSANLGGFDEPVPPVPQDIDCDYHCFTDADFPPVTGLTPRQQYRIPKTHGWQFKPDYDYYIWLDGSMSLTRPDSASWLLEHCRDMAFFRHPWRNTVKEEVEHIEDYIARRKGTKNGQDYLISRYKGGLHREQLEAFSPVYKDSNLYASNVFVYKNHKWVQDALASWWYWGTRFFTCDQVNLPYAIRYMSVGTIRGDVFKNDYVKVLSKHS